MAPRCPFCFHTRLGLTNCLRACLKIIRDGRARFQFMTTAKNQKYSRILLSSLRRRALGGENGVGICSEAVPTWPGKSARCRNWACRSSVVVGGGNIFSRCVRQRTRHRARHRRLHGNAGHDHQPRWPLRTRWKNSARPTARAKRHRHGPGRRAVHPPPRVAGTWKRAAW